VPFAILHGAERLGSPSLTSDLDIVVGRSPSEIARVIRSDLRNLELEVAMIWQYDLGGTASVFVSSSDGARGAQIDCLYDPAGKGRYGIRSNILLAERTPTSSFPTVAALDRDLYLIRKAHCKGRDGTVKEISTKLTQVGIGSARGRAEELFSPAAAADVFDNLRGMSVHHVRLLRVGRNLVRRIRRLVTPIGFWAELVGTEAQSALIAQQLRDQFRGWLIRADADVRPVRLIASTKWWITKVLPIILRPALFISWTSEKRLWPVPNVAIVLNDESSSQVIGHRIVSEMAARANN
jgi:hypothetical protein